MMPSIAIRANAGKLVGLGHVRRCLTLAEALSSRGVGIHFITSSEPAAVDLIQRRNFRVTTIDAHSDLAEILDYLGRVSVDGLIVDSYDVDSAYLARVHESVPLLMIVDDIGDRYLPVDMVINGALYAVDLSYRVLPTTTLLLGGEYAILRSEFAEEPMREIREYASRILITVGGGDPSGLTETLVQSLSDAREELTFDVVIGPFFARQYAIAEMAAARPGLIHTHHDPANMRTLMLEADIAITGGGQTTYELAASGTPSVAIATAKNQLPNLRALAEAGSLVYAGQVTDPLLEGKVIPSLTKLIESPEQRRRMSEKGRALIDGRGADRVAQIIVEALGKV